MSKQKSTKAKDTAYILKMLLYLIVGSQWLRLVDTELTMQIPLPLGLVLGVAFASHEHFQLDRKLDYIVLVIATFVGFWIGSGVTLVIL